LLIAPINPSARGEAKFYKAYFHIFYNFDLPLADGGVAPIVIYIKILKR